MRGITNVVVSGGGGGGTTNAILYYMTGDPDYEGYFVRATGLLSGTVYNTELGADGNGYATVTGMEHYSLEFYYIDENDQEVLVFNDEIDANMGCFYYISIGYDITSWEGIQNILNAHKETELLTIGDELKVTIEGVEYTYQVGGINLYDSHEVIFVPKTCVGSTRQQRSSADNSGGWGNSDIRTYLNATFKNGLPNEIRNNLKQLEIKTSAGSRSTSLITTNDYVWLPRAYELIGTTNAYYASSEIPYCRQYPIFSTSNSRVRTLEGVSKIWWLSSPVVTNNLYYCGITVSGGLGAYSAQDMYGVVPCFRFTANN